MSILDLTHSGLLETYSRNARSIINHQILGMQTIVKQTSPRISLDLLAASSKTKLDRRKDIKIFWVPGSVLHHNTKQKHTYKGQSLAAFGIPNSTPGKKIIIFIIINHE